MSNQHLIDEGLRYLQAQRSVAPVKGKFPWMSEEFNGETSWELYKTERITPDNLRRLCNDNRTTGLCMICGRISGGVEILDFDFKLGECWYERWRELVGELADGLPVVRTGGGGYQLGYLCPNPEGNQKLAHIATGDSDQPWKALIESRGEGGLVVIPPSIHPDTGKVYQFLTGHFTALPMISQERRDLLWAAARSLCQKPKEAPKPVVKRRVDGWQRMQGESVIEAFNRLETIHWWLEQYHYTIASDGWAIRPGGERKTVKIKGNRSYHNAGTDKLNDGYWRTPFELMLQHNDYGKGDFLTALACASKITGIPIQTWSKPPDAPQRSESSFTLLQAPEIIPGRDFSLVVITDSMDDTDLLQGLGVAAVVSDRFAFDLPYVQRLIEPYARKIVMFKPADDGAAQSLAADLGAEVVELPSKLTDYFEGGAHSLIDFVAAIRTAFKPVFRLGAKLGRRL